MQNIETLSNTASKVCEDTIKALNKVSPKVNHPAYAAKRSAKNLLEGAIDEFKKIPGDKNIKHQELFLEYGLRAINSADKFIEKIKGVQSPTRLLFEDILEYATGKDHAHDADFADDFHGIKIPFPTPEAFAELMRQIFRKE